MTQVAPLSNLTGADEVFILDLTRQDGTRFVTSVGTAGSVRAARMRHKGVAGQVSHWKRDRTVILPGTPGPRHFQDWRLNERFGL